MSKLQDKLTPENKNSRKVTGYIGAGVWIFLLLFFGQSTWASMYENEVRAAMIYAGFTGIIFFSGVITYYSKAQNKRGK